MDLRYGFILPARAGKFQTEINIKVGSQIVTAPEALAEEIRKPLCKDASSTQHRLLTDK